MISRSAATHHTRPLLLLLAVVLACGTASAMDQVDSLYYATGSSNPHVIYNTGEIWYVDHVEDADNTYWTAGSSTSVTGLELTYYANLTHVIEWQPDSSITSGLGDIGGYSAPTVFQKDGTWYLIAGSGSDTFVGFSWTGSAWQSDSSIVSGLGGVSYSAPTVFQKDGTWYLISGEYYGAFTGFSWTGSAWQSDSSIVSGLGDVGDHSTPTVFQKDGTWYLISGEYNGVFTGFNWTGSAWQSDSSIVSGLGDVGYHSAPIIFQKDGTWYLISGENSGVFIGFNWTGSTWQSDSSIVSGLGDVGSFSTPTVFQKDGTWYLISGEDSGTFTGWHLFQDTFWTAETSTIGEFTISSGTLDWFRITNLTIGRYYSIAPVGGDPINTKRATSTAITFTSDLPEGNYTINQTSYAGETGIQGVVYEGTTETNAPIPSVIVTIYNNTYSDTTVTDSSGYYLFTGLTNSTYILTFTKDRYITVDFQYVTPTYGELYNKDVWMQKDTGQFYSRHYVTFCVCNIWGTRYPGVDTVCYTTDNGNIDSTGTTGGDGTVTLSLFEDVEYSLTFTNATQGISEDLTLYPRDDYYYIIVGDTSTWTETEHAMCDEIHITVAKKIINDTYVWINITYTDDLDMTTELDAYINETNLNDTANETPIAHYAFTGNLNDTSHNFTVPMRGGQAYFVRLHNEHTEFGSNWYTYTVRRVGMMLDLGLPSGVYIYICIIFILFVGAMFGGTTSTTGAVSISALGWIFLAFGWLQPALGIFAPISVSAASVYAVSVAIIHRQRKAGYA